MPCRLSRARFSGLTLIELLLALALMAVLGILSWRGVDALLATRERTHAASVQSAAIATLAAQWAADLDNMRASEPAHTWHFERTAAGRPLLRLTRSAPDGVGWSVVAYGLTPAAADGPPSLLRWQSPAVATVEQWQRAWDESALHISNSSKLSEEKGRENTSSKPLPTPLIAASDFHVRHWSAHAWREAQPLSDTPNTAPNTAKKPEKTTPKIAPLPHGLELKLQLHSGTELLLQWANPARERDVSY